MTYISAKFGRQVVPPPVRKIPGPFSAAHISAYAEERIGELMLAAEIKAGHRAKLPPDVRPPFDPAHYIRTVTRSLEDGPASLHVIREAVRLGEGNTKTVLDYMRKRGLVEYVSGNVRKWRLIE